MVYAMDDYEQSSDFENILYVPARHSLFCTFFSGYVGGSHHNHLGGGSNFLCMPENPEYHKNTDPFPSRNRALLYGVEYEIYSGIFDTKLASGSLNYYDAVCSVCKVHGRDSVLMIPGVIECPHGWTKEYRGYLMAPKKEFHRAEYICVDANPEFPSNTERTDQKAGYLNFVDTNCDALKCPPYRKDKELSCVVCSY